MAAAYRDRERGIGQEKDVSTVSDGMAVDRVRAHRHGHVASSGSLRTSLMPARIDAESSSSIPRAKSVPLEFVSVGNSIRRLCYRGRLPPGFVGAVGGDIGQPQPIRRRRGELTPHPVVMDRRAGLRIQTASGGEHTPDPLCRTQPMPPVLPGGDAAAG